MFKYIGLMAFTIVLVGCAGKAVILKNAAGDTQKCEVDAIDESMSGYWATRKEIKACITALEKAGYKKVE